MTTKVPGDFELWYPGAHRKVLAALIAFVGDPDEAAEAADEAIGRAYERWSRVANMDAPEAWTIRIGLNIARRRARRRAFEARLLRQRAPSDAAPPAGETWQLLEALSLRQREVVVLRYLVDLTEQQIGDSLSISRSTVSSTLTDALRRLRQQLAQTPTGGA